MRLSLVALLLLTAACIQVEAKETASPAAVRPVVQAQSVAKPELAVQTMPSEVPWKERPETIALEAQNKTIKEYHSSLLDTVYWALAVMAGIVALLVGANWLVNFKLNEQDKERLRRDFENRISALQTSWDGRLASFGAEQQNAVRLQLEATIVRFESEINTLREEIKNAEATSTAHLAQLGEVQKEAGLSLSILRKSISDVEATTRRVEEHVWEIKKIPNNVLMTQAQGLDAAMDAENKWMVESTLQRMKLTLKRMDKNHPLSAGTRDDILGTVNASSKFSPVLADEVATLLTQSETGAT